jgi:4-amino-4-deoxy-L-arabinose transferase-like glycosyltransferase
MNQRAIFFFHPSSFILHPSALAWGGLIVFCSLLFLTGLGGRDLTSSHEARAAQNAQTILDDGDWLMPRLFDRRIELQKPPLYYWLVALIAWMHGGQVDAWSVRLPAALSALACVLFLFFVGIQSKRPLAGYLAALILGSFLHFTWLARVGRVDMPLTTTITVALGAFHLGNLKSKDEGGRMKDEPESRQSFSSFILHPSSLVGWHAAGYASLGIGLLLKGPIALLLPSVVAGAAWLLRMGGMPTPPIAIRDKPLRLAAAWAWHTLHMLRSTSLWWGIPLALALAAPWFVWANFRTNNQLWEVFFWYHNVERGLGGSEVLKAHPLWFYLPRMVVDLLPWSLVVPGALYWFIRNREIRKDDDAWLGLIWFAAIALFLSCMSFKRADYLLPAYPGMAIFLGVCAERWWRCRKGESETKDEGGRMKDEPESRQSFSSFILHPSSLIVAGLAGLLVYVAGWQIYQSWFLPPEEKYWPGRAMAEKIRHQTDGPVIFFRAESHLFTYYVGRPVDTILEWENLEWWANRPRPIYFIMPEDCARNWRDHLATGSLEEVLYTTDYVEGKRDRPLVVLRSGGK